MSWAGRAAAIARPGGPAAALPRADVCEGARERRGPGTRPARKAAFVARHVGPPAMCSRPARPRRPDFFLFAVTSRWLPKENPKFSSNLYWLVMVVLEKLHL